MRTRRLWWASPILVSVSVNAVALVQTSRVEFEVASIKLSTRDGQGSRLHPTPDGGVQVVNMTLGELVECAYPTVANT